jgi:hypothetical protein
MHAMSHTEFNQILSSIVALSPDQVRQLMRELESRAAQTNRPAQAPAEAGQDAAVDAEFYRRIMPQLEVGQDAAEESAFDVASRAGLSGGMKGESNSPTDLTEEESANQELQRRLFNAGLLSEIKPPLRDLTPYRDRKPVPIKGEPLSETVIRERR